MQDSYPNLFHQTYELIVEWANYLSTCDEKSLVLPSRMCLLFDYMLMNFNKTDATMANYVCLSYLFLHDKDE